MSKVRYVTNRIEIAEYGGSISQVEAIPIEWIKNVWLKKSENQGEIEFFPTPTFEVVMNWLIDDWEKENETNVEC